MAPKKKRRRKINADSGLGVSLQENNAQLIQKEISVQEGNLYEECEWGETGDQLSQAGNSCITKENGPLEAGQGFLEENYHPETLEFLETVSEAPREENISSEESVCPPNKESELLETQFPEKAAQFPSETNPSSLEAESHTNKEIQNLEREASDACRNDSDSEETIRELLQVVNDSTHVSDKETESELPGCTACADSCNNSHVDSLETEIFVGTSSGPRNLITSHIPHPDENFSLSKICASQKTGHSEAEGEDIEEVISPKNHGIPSVRHMLTVVSHSCPENIGVQTKILQSDRQRPLNPVLPPVRKNMPFGSKIGFQFRHSNLTGFHFSRGHSVIHESREFVEQLNRENQHERGDGSNQTLSVWSEAQSEYFPRGKPSDLGELLEVPTRYVVTAWVKAIHPPISGPPTNLVIKFCTDCHKKFYYDENDANHLCSKSVGGSQKSLKLMFYVELEIYDETQETLKVALTGDQATKLFGCQPQEFVRNEEYQKIVWDSFKHLLKGGNRQNWYLKDAANFSLEPHLKGKKMNYRVVNIRPFGSGLGLRK